MFSQPTFVTGAAGFLAQRLVRRLLESGACVRGLVRSSSSAEILLKNIPECCRNRLEVVTGDLLCADDCRRALAGCGVVFHVAAQLTGGAAPLILTNVIGTKRLIQAAADAGATRLVLVSSIAVYDTQKLRHRAVVDESLSLDPLPHLRDPYTFSKVEQEHAARAACNGRGLPLVVVRPGVIYGPGRECLCGRVGLRSGRWMLAVEGGHALPYTHVENCSAAVLLAGLTPGIEGQAFNIVDDDAPSGNEIVRAYHRAGRTLTTVTIPFSLMKRLGAWNQWYHRWSQGQLPAVITPYKVEAMWKPLWYSNARAKERLGWQPLVSWREAISECLATP